tara:strand:- start:283 stop:468 length:186 start_codon:yes stop_codon:yes gene_type:complete
MSLSLSQKIGKIHPSLGTGATSDAWEGIVLANDADGKGDYIKEWVHSSLSEPTEQQLSEAG